MRTVLFIESEGEREREREEWQAARIVHSDLRRQMDGEEKKADAGAVNGDDSATDKKKPFKIEFDSILAVERDQPPDELVIVPDNPRRRPPQKRKKPTPGNSSSKPSASSSSGEDFSRMSDAELVSTIDRNLVHVAKFGARLPDKGEKLLSVVRHLRAELDRRKLRRANQDDGIKPMDSGSSSISGDVIFLALHLIMQVGL